MPFRNEGYEPINTIISINNTTNPDNIEIIVICDTPEYEYEEQIKRFPNVIFIKNKQSIGVDACRSMGINLANTEAVLVIDAHMRFSHDDWVNKIHDAVMEHPKTIWCTRSVVLSDTMSQEELDPMKDVLYCDRYYSTGAYLKYTHGNLFGQEWMAKSSFLEKTDGYVPSILGANYAGNTTWLRNIRSFEGMLTWGFSEQYISIKNWLFGGDCRGLDSVSIGHIFRTVPPYKMLYIHEMHNQLFTAHTLFSDEEDIFENFMAGLDAYMIPDIDRAKELLDSRWDIVSTYKSYFLTKKTQKLTDYFDRFNVDYKSIIDAYVYFKNAEYKK